MRTLWKQGADNPDMKGDHSLTFPGESSQRKLRDRQHLSSAHRGNDHRHRLDRLCQLGYPEKVLERKPRPNPVARKHLLQENDRHSVPHKTIGVATMSGAVKET